VFPRKELAFGGRDDTATHLMGQVSKRLFWGHGEAFSSLARKILKLVRYRNYCMDSNQILHLFSLATRSHALLYDSLNLVVSGVKLWTVMRP